MARVLNFYRGYSAAQSAFYDTVIAPGTLAAAAPVLAEAAVAAPPSGAVLDVGCGGGQALLALSGSRPDLRCVGADASAALISRAQARVGATNRSVMFAVASALQLPFAAERFDVVFTLFALKHWPDQQRGLRECVRVAKPGGTLIVAELDALADRDRWRSFVNLTRIPAPLRGVYVRTTLKPIVARSIRPDRLQELFERLPVAAIEVSPHPELALVHARATVDASGLIGGS